MGGGRLERGHLRLQRSERALDLAQLCLLAPGYERGGVGVGGDLGRSGRAAGGVDVDDRIESDGRVGGALHLGREVVPGARRRLPGHQTCGALLQDRAADGGGDTLQRVLLPIGVGGGLPGQRSGSIELRCVHDLGGRFVHLGLSRGNKERCAGGHHDDEDDEPRAPHEHVGVVAQGHALRFVAEVAHLGQADLLRIEG